MKPEPETPGPLDVQRFLPGLPVPTGGRRFYECGCCGAYHSDEWWGDCRQDDARFFPDDLDSMFGSDGWTEVSMSAE